MYAPVGIEEDGGFHGANWSPEFTRAGDFTFGWSSSPDSESSAISVSVWPTGDGFDRYADEGEPREYADGSVIWWMPGGYDEPGLLMLPDQPCVFELRASSRVASDWLFSSLRPISSPPGQRGS